MRLGNRIPRRAASRQSPRRFFLSQRPLAADDSSDAAKQDHDAALRSRIPALLSGRTARREEIFSAIRLYRHGVVPSAKLLRFGESRSTSASRRIPKKPDAVAPHRAARSWLENEFRATRARENRGSCSSAAASARNPVRDLPML